MVRNGNIILFKQFGSKWAQQEFHNMMIIVEIDTTTSCITLTNGFCHMFSFTTFSKRISFLYKIHVFKILSYVRAWPFMGLIGNHCLSCSLSSTIFMIFPFWSYHICSFSGMCLFIMNILEISCYYILSIYLIFSEKNCQVTYRFHESVLHKLYTFIFWTILMQNSFLGIKMAQRIYSY